MQGVVRYTCRIRDLVLGDNLAPPFSVVLAEGIPHLLYESLGFMNNHRRQHNLEMNMTKICDFPGPILLEQSYGWVDISVNNKSKQFIDKASAEEMEFRLINLMILTETTGEMAAAAVEMGYIGRSSLLFRKLRSTSVEEFSCVKSLLTICCSWGRLAWSTLSARHTKVVEDILEKGVLHLLEWFGATYTEAVEENELDFKRKSALSSSTMQFEHSKFIATQTYI